MIVRIISYLASSSSWMLMGRAIQYMSQMVLVLVLPKVLMPEEYIQFNLVLPLAFLGATLSFGWLTNAIVRHAYELLDDNSRVIKDTMVAYFGGVTILYVALFVIISIFTGSPYRLVSFLIAAVGLKNAVLGVLNSSGNSWRFLWTNVGFAVSLLIFILLCARSPGSDISAYMIVWASLDFLVALAAWYGLGVLRISRRLPHFDRSTASRYFGYGGPLVANMLGVWVISLSDRYLLTLWEAPVVVADYVLSYQLAGSAITVPMSFLVAMLVPKILYIEKHDGHEKAMAYNYRILARFVRYAPVIFVAACAIVIPFKYFIYPDYEFRPAIIVLIVLAHVIYSLVHFYNKEFELNGRTIIITKSVLLGAAINVGLNIVLIPLVGSLGAAVSTLVAYTATVFTIYRSGVQVKSGRASGEK